ncbi:hypothetical protein F4777DRAFT_574413 [Nemania sp. FL0916]|nr:hypothetical protein F4777DRAFT_574413 [Nemania sp. FL0916]
MRLSITFLSLFLAIFPGTTAHAALSPTANTALAPATALGNTECSAASSNTSFRLTFISYGTWTVLPSEGGGAENPIQRLESVAFSVANAANGVGTECAFSLGVTLTSTPTPGTAALQSYTYPFPVPEWVVKGEYDERVEVGDGGRANGGEEGDGDGDAIWQGCADRKDTDGTHRFTIATGGAFRLVDSGLDRSLVRVNQTWFCHDELRRLVAFTGVASAEMDLTCSESEISGYHLRNCTSSDLSLPVTLL